VILAVLVDADDHLLALVDHRLPPRGRFLDAQLRQPALDGLGHAAHLLDLLDQGPGLSISSLVRLST
jgi:hypothetical protein